MVDLYQLAAERIHKVPEGWKWCRIDCASGPKGYTEVAGAVPLGVFKSGPRKGRPKWPKESELRTIWVSQEEIQQVAREWESETGKCHQCEGEGQTVKSASVLHGCTYRACERCGGSGVCRD